MDSKGQISAEYLFLILIFLIILGSVTVPLAGKSISSSMNVSVTSDAKTAVSTIANAVDVVYANGPQAIRTVNVYFPQDTTLSFNSGSLFLNLNGVSYTNGAQKATVNSSVPYNNITIVNTTINKGWHNIQVTWPVLGNTGNNIIITVLN